MSQMPTMGPHSKNCNSSYKCVKCDQYHTHGECARIRSETSESYCVNCKYDGHPANWRGCPTYKNYINRSPETNPKKVKKRKLLREIISVKP